MFYLYFCSKEDEANLAVSVARLREIEPCARVFVGVDNDPARRAQVPQGCHAVPIVLHRVPARSGLPAVAFDLHSVTAMLGLMQTIMETYGETHILKLDADMFCNDLRLLLPGETVAPGLPEPDFVAPEAARPLLPGPGCFRISLYAVRWCLKYIRQGHIIHRWPAGPYAENIFLYHLMAQSRMSLHLIPFATGYLAGYTQTAAGIPEPVRTAGLIHCGEPLTSGTRAPREVVLARMLLLQKLYK